ncbi:G-patch domain-containing protein [Purpureocillium lavendulum]|uniref:Protein SQS1 n=1 Tax=Purpureocillium lavendulum TaxID=1247861 RepID=A0AB34FNA0_9HYPO|nr:G-patch domain-containing protein [Purpureocillium lavendulum]
MADEARQTSQHDHSTWSSSSKLRSQPIQFRSAGLSEPLKNDDSTGQEEGLASVQPSPHIEQPINSTGDEAEESVVMGPEELEQVITQSNQKPPAIASTRASFFYDLVGERHTAATSKAAIAIPDRHRSPSTSSGDEVILFRGRGVGARPQPPVLGQRPVTRGAVEPQLSTAAVNASSTEAIGDGARGRDDTQISIGNGRHRQRKIGKRGGRRVGHGSEEDALLADYISNMRENGEMDDALNQHLQNQRDLGGTESDRSDPSVKNRLHEDGGWCRAMRFRGDDAPDGTTSQDIRQSSPRGSTENGRDQSDSGVDDETLAKLIAGQGISSGPEIDGEGEIPSDTDSTSSSDKGHAALGTNPDFDFMDWERPSLRPRKGRKSRAPVTFNVSDSDLEQQLQMAWNNDRLKKKQRKQQREELRALGLLGQRPQADDLRIKYPVGMSMQDVAEEFRVFLTGTDESRSFPPMDLHARKVIHELANQFKINSKSTGKAEQRRTTLHRTIRTLSYNEVKFEQAVSRIHRRYLPRLDVKGKRKPGNSSPAAGSHAATSYRDGEVVGAAAPELGTGNRGRAMLEKMGWSSGTALGATHNKGILQPVTQTMKRTKAGLG